MQYFQFYLSFLRNWNYQVLQLRLISFHNILAVNTLMKIENVGVF